MTIHAQLRRSITRRPLSSVCWRCESKRFITQKYLKRKQEGREQWARQAEEIRAGTRKSVIDILQERGLFHALTGSEDVIREVVLKKRVGAYVGIDPTAASLHVGHMVPVMALFWMYVHGCEALTLIGGSTARIGDPTGRTTDREQLTTTERKANITAVHYQLKRMWVNVEKLTAKHGYPGDEHQVRGIVNNNNWWNSLPMLDVLKLLGSCFRIGPMLGKDTVKNKLESGVGMSLAEFCYPVMQAWDWWYLYNTRGIQVQIGGSDQFGNITSGVDAVKHIVKTHPDPDVRYEDGVAFENTPFGLTTPLLTTASGNKFGKSAGNAIWLDEQMTSTFDLYGFFVGTDDKDVKRYLKLFTFLSLGEIDKICAEQALDPGKRVAHHALAYEFVRLIHGDAEADKAQKQHKASRSQSFSDLLSSTEETTKPKKPNPLLTHQNAQKREQGTFVNRSLNKFAPVADANSPERGPMKIILPKSLIYMQPIARVLYAAGLVSSRSEGHKLVQNKGAYIGQSRSSGMNDSIEYVQAKLRDPAQSWEYVNRDTERTNEESKSGEMYESPDGEEGLLILRTGKWKIRIIRIVSDEVFEAMNLDPPPGWKEFKAEKIAQAAKAEFRKHERKEELEHADQAAKFRKSSSRRAEAQKSPMEQSDIEGQEAKDTYDPETDDGIIRPTNAAQIVSRQRATQARAPSKQNIKNWDDWQSIENDFKPNSKVKTRWENVKQGQRKATAYFRKQGVDEETLRQSSWRGWRKKTPFGPLDKENNEEAQASVQEKQRG